MRFEGDLSVIQKIEDIIKEKTGYALLKDEPVNSPCNKNHKATLYTRLYCIFLNPYTFDVRLLFDHRNNTGRFDLKDVNSQVLFVKVPELTKELGNLKTMLVSKRNGANYEVKEIAL